MQSLDFKQWLIKNVYFKPLLTPSFSLFSVCAILAFAGCDAPKGPDIAPTYKWVEKDKAKGSSGERGSMLINEINYAGSVSDSGQWDPDDIFIELWNKHPRPINPTGWRIEVMGDFNASYRIPPVEKAIPPNGFFVIAAKKDGAFGDSADVVIPNLRLGQHLVAIELRDMDRKLIEEAGSDRQRVFAGGYDTVTVRSMERAQIIFGNRGGLARNWHAFSDDKGTQTIKEGYRLNTLASPATTNSSDYSGNAASGNFE